MKARILLIAVSLFGLAAIAAWRLWGQKQTAA